MSGALAGVRVSCGASSYAWDEDWIRSPADQLAGAGWAHHDLAVTRDGMIASFQSGGEFLCLFRKGGELADCWPTGVVEGHGITATKSASGDELLYIADPGFTAIPDGQGGYQMHAPRPHGDVVVFDLLGDRITCLGAPLLPTYSSARYAPTAVAVDGDRRAWVADGYGQSLVHRFSHDGELELTLTGEEGAGRFACPHSLMIDGRASEPRLYITDRSNARLQVYDMKGRFLHQVAEGLRSPSALAVHGETLIVAELHARLAVFDAHDRLVGYLGRDDDATTRDGWPNARDAGRTVRPSTLRPGRFNSPHGLAVGDTGDVYVAEWLIGGRVIRLRRED